MSICKHYLTVVGCIVLLFLAVPVTPALDVPLWGDALERVQKNGEDAVATVNRLLEGEDESGLVGIAAKTQRLIDNKNLQDAPILYLVIDASASMKGMMDQVVTALRGAELQRPFEEIRLLICAADKVTMHSCDTLERAASVAEAITPSGSTWLGEAFWEIAQMMVVRKNETREAVCVLSDGEASDSNKAYQILKKMLLMGVHVGSVALDAQRDTTLARLAHEHADAQEYTVQGAVQHVLAKLTEDWSLAPGVRTLMPGMMEMSYVRNPAFLQVREEKKKERDHSKGDVKGPPIGDQEMATVAIVLFVLLTAFFIVLAVWALRHPNPLQEHLRNERMSQEDS